MKSKLRWLVTLPLMIAVIALMVTHPPGIARAGISATTPIAIGSTTPVAVATAGPKDTLIVTNTGATNALYCLIGGTGTASTTNFTFILPAAASTAGTTAVTNSWTSPVLNNPTKVGQSRSIPDAINCISNASTTAQVYSR